MTRSILHGFTVRIIGDTYEKGLPQLLVQTHFKGEKNPGFIVSYLTKQSHIYIQHEHKNRIHMKAGRRIPPLDLCSTEQHTPSSNVRAARPARGYKGTAYRLTAASLKVRREGHIYFSFP